MARVKKMPKRQYESTYTTVAKRIKTAPVALTRSYAPRRFTGLDSELKFFDTAISFDVDATGEVPATGQLVLIPQNDTETGRDGRHCSVKSIQLRLALNYVPGATTSASCIVDIWVVQDTQCNGVAATLADVTTGGALSTTLINLDNSQRFRVLKKLRWEFAPGAGIQSAFGSVTKRGEYYAKCDIPLMFSAAAGAITELKTNNLFLLAGESGLNSDDLVSVSGNCRVRFSDRT